MLQNLLLNVYIKIKNQLDFIIRKKNLSNKIMLNPLSHLVCYVADLTFIVISM